MIANQNISIDTLERPRLFELLKKAINYPLVVICAGAGYGKTRAVCSFLSELRGADVTWMQISEPESNETIYREDYAAALAKSKAKAAFKKQIIVADDFHLIRNPSILRQFERSVNTFPQNAALIIVTRTMPEFDMLNMMRRERVFVINEDALSFTENEIRDYCAQQGSPIKRNTLRAIYNDTRGWAFAVNMITHSLQNNVRYKRHSLGVMKENITRHIGTEISAVATGALWRFLLRVSLVDKLPASFIKTLPGGKAHVKDMNRLFHAYIRCDIQSDTYLIHHLLLDYLRQHQHELTEREKRDTFQKAGAWCETNNYLTDAITYYGNAGDYSAIAKIIASYGVRVPPDMTELAIEIFDRAPEEKKIGNSAMTAMYIRLKLNIGSFDEALAIAQKYSAIYENMPDSHERNRALVHIYASYALVRLFMCAYDGVYDFDIFYKKACEIFQKNPFDFAEKYSLLGICTWASLVGTPRAEAHEEYIGAVSRTIKSSSILEPGSLTGFDDLARGELCFYREEFDAADKHLKQAIKKIRGCNRNAGHSQALYYSMLIAVFRSDHDAARQCLKELQARQSDADFGETTYDIAHGFYHLILQQPEQTPTSLKGDFSHYVHPSYIENYANRVKVLYHYQTEKYGTLLAYIENEQDRQAIIYGRIELAIMKAHTLFKLKQRAEAFAALSDAYHLAEPKKITLPFMLLAKDMRALASAALKNSDCKIPKQWLENIIRKTSAYSKLRARIISEYMTANRIKENPLSKREVVYLGYLRTGLSHPEIAALQNISASAVKRVVYGIYDKLCAGGLEDALKISTERGIIK